MSTNLGLRGLVVASALLLALSSAARAETAKIEFWHAMGGNLGKTIERIVEQYNNSQANYKVEAVYKGSYNDTYNAGVAAFRAKKQPHVLQVLSWGTGQFISAKGVYVSISDVMGMAGVKFDQSIYNPGVIAYYSDNDGNLLSMPWNSSTPILFWNKEIFAKVGLDPENPPGTWEEMYWMSKRIIDRGGATCGFTIGWQFWVLENLGAWHNVELSTNGNGFGDINSELAMNKPFFVEMVQALADWQKEGVFKYGGRRGDPNKLFTTGECAMVLNSSAYYGGFKKTVTFSEKSIGQTFLPYWASKVESPQNSFIGGATLWVFSGHDDVEYSAVADFFQFLSLPEVQKDWHVSTGYIPITTAAYDLAAKEGHYERNPGADIAIKQVSFNKATLNSRGHRLATLLQIGDIMNNELEAVWSGQKSAQQALDDGVRQANEANKRFVRSLQ